MKILLVEDKNSDASLIMDLINLKFNAANITWVPTLSQGLTEITNKLFNLIILDLGLPDSSGIETLLKVKNETNSPIVILTGHDDEELGALAVKRGAQDYLVKGTDSSHLCRSLKYAIQRHGREVIAENIRQPKKEFTQGITHLTNIVNSLNNSLESSH